MKLFLCSSNLTKNLCDDLKDLIGTPIDNLKVVFITTASNPTPEEGRSDARSYQLESIEQLKQFPNWEVTELDIEKYEKNNLKDYLASFDVIFMDGGYTGYLMNVLNEYNVPDFLFELLNSNIIYIGSSTGSMIMSKTFTAAEWYPGEEDPKSANISGLGLIDFEIFPHYKDDMLKEIQEKRSPNIDYYLLSDGQAISYDNGVIKTHGGNISVLPKQNNLNKKA
jgi:peptidase E